MSNRPADYDRDLLNGDQPTLRDRFALTALISITPYVDVDLLPEVAKDGEDYYHFEFFAGQAYKFADAMLEARKQK